VAPPENIEAGIRPTQRKNQAMLPNPPRSPGTVSNSTANAATRAITGTQKTRIGASSLPAWSALSSPATSWATKAITASTATMARSTAKLLAALPRV
jgi:hypothetical protein